MPRHPAASEHTEQTVVIGWARAMTGRWPMLRWLHSNPNHNFLLSAAGRQAGARVTAYMKAEGLTRGIPDLFLPWPSGRFHGCYLELKVGDNRPTPEQAEFLSYAQEAGYYAAVCHSAEQAIAALEAYLSLEPEREE